MNYLYNAKLFSYEGEKVIDIKRLQISQVCWNMLASGVSQYEIEELPVLGSNQIVRLVGDEFSHC